MNIMKLPVLCLVLLAFFTGLAIPPAEGGDSAAMPSASAKDLWSYLTKEKYEQSFTLWPGKGKLYKGTEPHGALLTTYVNKPALGAIQGKKGAMPAGAIVVKENYTPDKNLAAVTVIYKVAGFNPEAGDWFWAKYAPDGRVLAEGKVAGCLGCHGKVKGNDYLFTGELK